MSQLDDWDDQKRSPAFRHIHPEAQNVFKDGAFFARALKSVDPRVKPEDDGKGKREGEGVLEFYSPIIHGLRL